MGFLAFNGGSELAIVGSAGHGQAVAVSFMNTIIGGAAGAMFSITLNYAAAVVRRMTLFFYYNSIYLKLVQAKLPTGLFLPVLTGG